MKIGVISDTHVRTFDEIPAPVLRALEKVDLIVHAGDFTRMEVLEGLSKLGEVKAVCGNMDSDELKRRLPPRELFTVDGKQIGLVHGWGAPWGIAERVKKLFGDADIVIYGHSHQSFNKHLQGSLLFNPGQAKHSFGLITIGDGIRAEIVRV